MQGAHCLSLPRLIPVWGSPDMQLAASQVNSHAMLGTAASAAVTQKKTKTNSKQARHGNSAASHGGKSAKGNPLTGSAPGQGFPIQNQMSNGSGLSDAYSWRRYVPDRLRHRVVPKVAQGAFNPTEVHLSRTD